MIKWLLGVTVAAWIIVSMFTNIGFGSFFASSVFVVGLLVIIALNVQPKKEASDDDEPYVTDADLFEDFDDPYAEAEDAAAKPARRTRNPRTKVQS